MRRLDILDATGAPIDELGVDDLYDAEGDYFDCDAGPPDDFGIDPADREFCSCEGPYCAACGCCQHRACPGGCVWATPTLCSRCIP